MRRFQLIQPTNWFNNLTIKRKITYLYLPLAIIPMILFAMLSTHLYEASIIKRSLDSMASNNTLISNQIESILTQAESCSTYLTLSINNLVYHSSSRTNRLGDVKFNSLLTNELAYAKLIFNEIDSIAFVDTANHVFLSQSTLHYALSELIDSPHMAKLRTSTGNNLWQDISQSSWFNTEFNKPVLTLSKKIWNIQTGETIGYLFINISEESLSKLFDDQLDHYFIINPDNLIISTNQRDRLFSAVTESKLKTFARDAVQTSQLLKKVNGTFMVSKKNMQHLNWTLLSEANLENYTADLRSLLLLTVLLLLTIILIDIAMSKVLNQWITSPINKLIGGLQNISEGRFDYRFNMKTNDEIGLFAKQFNEMSEQIGDLLLRIEDQEAKKRAYELALIQEQIKPHFLYNTLDIIMKLIEMGQNKKAQKATKKLADFYRLSLSGGAAIVTIEEELKLTSNYLALQKIRYSDAFDYTITLPESIQYLKIPKLSLQPLVENAIYHGLKYRSENGSIRIDTLIEGDDWQLSITDNGIGLTAEAVRALNHDLAVTQGDLLALSPIQTEGLKHFGIHSVNHRIKLFFGPAYGLHYTSIENQGTSVHIRLPLVGAPND